MSVGLGLEREKNNRTIVVRSIRAKIVLCKPQEEYLSGVLRRFSRGVCAGK